jgi:TusE/DsrC/DsvC family sulfur relay protein
MGELKLGARVLEVDDKGFIQQSDEWDREVAAELARQEGVGQLTAAHWRVIDFVRAHYQKHQVAPMIRQLCRETRFDLRQIYELFPTGPAQGACKVAGLPKPEGCV